MADLRSALSELTWDEERLRVDFLKILDAIRAEFPRAPTHTLEGYLGTLLAEIRRLRAALTARDELLAKAGEDAAWDWIESQYLDAEKGYHPNDRAYSSDEMVDAFMAGQDHAASLAAELKEKQP